MKKIVITGGPCGGKTAVITAIQEEFRDQVTIVPEVASMLLSSGFPNPGRDVEWSQEWQNAFETAIVWTQRAIEKAKFLEASKNGHKLLICDRGILDGAAFLPGGLDELAADYGVDIQATLKEYVAVIHLESLATADPALYGRAGNENRFEPVERAAQIELATRTSWGQHKHRVMIPGSRGIEGKVSQVLGIVRFVLAEVPDS